MSYLGASMQMTDTLVGIRVRIANFRDLAHRVALLPEPFRPSHFSKGGRVINKDVSRVDDPIRFSDFVDKQVDQVSGFDLVGKQIRFGFFVGETRTANHESTHVGCSIILRGRKWKSADFALLLKLLCAAPGMERAYSCRRAEWERRHLYVKSLPPISIQTTLGVDMSASLPSLYWWTVFSNELAERHNLRIDELVAFAEQNEHWITADGKALHAFRLYHAPDDWEREEGRISAFLRSHPSFFSMARIQTSIEEAATKEEFDSIARPFRAGAVPWEASPPTARYKAHPVSPENR